jgi:cytochrome P450
MLKLISDHQSVQHELRHVLRTVFDAAVSESRQPTAHEIAKADIPFLDAVIDECLRIGGPAPMVAREAMTDTVLLGHHIPKGMTLLINNAGPGFKTKPVEVVDSTRSESSIAKTRGGTWNVDDLHLFKPERWLKTNDKGDVIYDAQAGPFLTFSLGPRGCFGRRLAYLEIRLILVLLLWNFHFKQLKGELVSYDTKESVTVMPKVCYVELERL